MSPVPEEGEHDAKPPDSNPIDHVDVPDVFIEANSSDSEEDDDVQGYQMLPQDPDDDDDANDEQQDENDRDEVDSSHIDEVIRNTSVHSLSGGGTPSYMQVPDLPKPDPQSLLWNQQGVETRLNLDDENAERIKAVMKKVQLPPCNIPDWAKNIPEDQWKAKIAKIQDHKS